MVSIPVTQQYIFFSDRVDLRHDIRSTFAELNSRGMKISRIAGEEVPNSPTDAGWGPVQKMMLDAHEKSGDLGAQYDAVPQSSYLEEFFVDKQRDRITSLKKTKKEAEADITSLTKAYDEAKAAITSLTKAYDEAKVGLSARSRNDQLDSMKNLLDSMRRSLVTEEATLTKTHEDAAEQKKRIKAAERFMETVQGRRHGEERRAAFASSSSAAAAAATSTASSSAAASAGATAPSAMGDEFAASSPARRKRRSSAIQCDHSRRRVLADDPNALAEQNTGFSKPEGEDDEVQFMEASSAPPHKRRKKPAKKKKKKKKDQAQVTPPLRVIATNPHERSTAAHAQWERDYNGAE